MTFEQTDSIIFDMDGTLWDAVDSYTEIWNRSSKDMGLDRVITNDDLIDQMGKPIAGIVMELYGSSPNFDLDRYIHLLEHYENTLMPVLGGITYPNMQSGIKQLSEKYKIFLISNCAERGLDMFMDYTGIREYITDSLTYGQTQAVKSINIKRLIDQYGLKNALYVGDTQGDCNETHRAGIPFVFASYGFGKCEDYEIAFDSFEQLSEYFLQLKK
ncbi:MAG: HAD family hydrolase [Bacteroidales bacterium]